MKTMTEKMNYVLDKMIELYSKPDTWTQHVYARNAADESVYTYDPVACKFCITGAIRHFTDSFCIHESPILGRDVLNYVSDLIYETMNHDPWLEKVSIATFNDRSYRTQEDVLKIIKAARQANS